MSTGDKENGKEAIIVNKDEEEFLEAEKKFDEEQKLSMIKNGQIPMDEDTRVELRKLRNVAQGTFWFHFTSNVIWTVLCIVLLITVILLSCIFWFVVDPWVMVMLCVEVIGVVCVCWLGHSVISLLFHYWYTSKEIPRMPSEARVKHLAKALNNLDVMG